MKQPTICLRDVNLHYAALVFKERSLKSLVVNCFKKRKLTNDVNDVHALKNINVDIRGGERIGLLGHNGAGKSTFLRTVAGLYPISSGELKVEGEVRSLFDLSLGFEQDATGRENILYRGLLLGLSPSFMHEHAEKIIEFADLGEFIDYPIKTYSAGMQVRLAFSISTSVGGNILLLDEIIGAGDAKFMSKAKQRIAQLIDQADILVLASHDFHTLNSLCQRGLVFYRGEVVFDGQISDAVNNYKKINGLS
ncbi:polysaccharide/polyol phosphate ABC transporter ATP-binding protein [Candidatus Williamhamiltonella defendens]|nr:polysaccharide/polyol phosphate ABC transporter ATP-binding protein [Candidatus Hamiltonella defensa]